MPFIGQVASSKSVQTALSNEHLHSHIDCTTHPYFAWWCAASRGLHYLKSLLSRFPSWFLGNCLQKTFSKSPFFRSFCLADLFLYYRVSIIFLTSPSPLSLPFLSDPILHFVDTPLPFTCSLYWASLVICSAIAVTWYYHIIILIFANISWFLTLQDTALHWEKNTENNTKPLLKDSYQQNINYPFNIYWDSPKWQHYIRGWMYFFFNQVSYSC